MKEFKFKENNQVKKGSLQLKINGLIFTFNPYAKHIGSALNRYIKTSNKFVEQIKTTKSDVELSEIRNNSAKVAKECINMILGKGACTRIFEGRVETFDDVQELITFIFENISTYCKQ